MPRLIVSLLVLLGCLAAAAQAGQPLTIDVSPEQSVAPANLFISIRVQPDANNRSLEIVADSGDFYRSSELPLDGDRAPRFLSLSFRNVPKGDYVVRGVLKNAAGRRIGFVEQEAQVMSWP